MGIFCGNIAPPDLHSSNSFLWLKFFSDDMISGRGFSAVATAEDPLCGSLVPLNVTSEEEILQSPGYGSAYPLGVTCQWVLAGPDWYERILIRVITMDLENSTACQKDRLEFSDVNGRAPVNQVAGTKKSPPVLESRWVRGLLCSVLRGVEQMTITGGRFVADGFEFDLFLFFYRI